MYDTAIVKALTDSLERDPDNVAVRIHLSQVLIDGKFGQDALAHLAHVLALQPTNQEALQLASTAAELAGDKIRAHSYRQLHEALSWNQARNLIGSDPADDKPFGDRAPSGLDDMHKDREPRQTSEPVRIGGDENETPPVDFLVENTNVTLKDVAGLEDVKRRLNLAFLAPLRNPDMMKLYGRSLRGGLLLYGPPGCGKTHIARATAGELGAKFMAIGLSDVLDMWLGQSEKNLHEIFEAARRNKPCVLFFDEIDALGRKRSLMRASAGRDVVNQLLAEMDSMGGDNDGLFILAATNHPWDVDTALRRPGRLDRTLLVIPPDQSARESILKAHMRERPADHINYASLAKSTDTYSGADVAHLVESAAELAMEASLKSGTVRPITMGDFKNALRDVKPSTRAWLDMARNFALFSNDGGAYDELVDYLRSRKII